MLFTSIFIGSKGSGKPYTYNVVKVSKNYEKLSPQKYP